MMFLSVQAEFDSDLVGFVAGLVGGIEPALVEHQVESGLDLVDYFLEVGCFLEVGYFLEVQVCLGQVFGVVEVLVVLLLDFVEEVVLVLVVVVEDDFGEVWVVEVAEVYQKMNF